MARPLCIAHQMGTGAPLAATAGDGGRNVSEGDLPVRDIDAQMNLPDLVGEGNQKEFGQEPIEQGERSPDLMLPEEG